MHPPCPGGRGVHVPGARKKESVVMATRPYAPEENRRQNDGAILRLVRDPARELCLARVRAQALTPKQPAELTAEQWLEAFCLGARAALAACPAPRRRPVRSRSRARLRAV